MNIDASSIKNHTQSGWTALRPRLCAVAGAVAAALLGWLLPDNFFRIADANWYLSIASGTPMQEVLQPFASRQLGPLVAKWLAAVLRSSVEHAFITEGIVSLLVLAVLLFGPLLRRETPAWIVAAIVLIPFWPELFHDLALPDLWCAALFAVLLFYLERGWYFAAACWLFPLMLSRESTVLALVCLLIACWKPMRWAARVTALAATVAAAMLAGRLDAGSPGNTEHLPQFLYTLLKAPWNFTRLLGVEPWSNRYTYLCTVPRWRAPLHLGPVQLGVCGFNGGTTLAALAALTVTFGLLPLLTGFLWWRSRPNHRRSPAVRFALLYGTLSFLLAPLVGVSYDRLFGYAWPLFLFALPRLAVEAESRELLMLNLPLGRWIIALQTIACGLALLKPAAGAWIGLLLWCAGFILIRKMTPRPEPVPA